MCRNALKIQCLGIADFKWGLKALWSRAHPWHFLCFLQTPQQTQTHRSNEHKGLKFHELQGHSSLSLPPLQASLLGTITHINTVLACIQTHLHSHSHAAVTVDVGVGSPAVWLGFPHLMWPSGWWDFPLKETLESHYCSASKPSHVGRPWRCPAETF